MMMRTSTFSVEMLHRGSAAESPTGAIWFLYSKHLTGFKSLANVLS